MKMKAKGGRNFKTIKLGKNFILTKTKYQEAEIIHAEEGDEFQEYSYGNGEKVPAGKVVGVEIKKGRKWQFVLLDGIKYSCR